MTYLILIVALVSLVLGALTTHKAVTTQTWSEAEEDRAGNLHLIGIVVMVVAALFAGGAAEHLLP